MFRPVLYASSISLRAAQCAVAISIVATSCSRLLAVGLNYVDANDFTNLTPTAAIDSFAATAEPDNLWDVRTDFGLGLTVLQASPTAASAEDAPQLTQKITGLMPGKSYDVYGVFTTDDDENWTMRAGVTPGNLSLYSFWGNRGPSPVPNSNQGITAGAAVWDTLPPANKESTFFTERPADTLVQLLGKAGTIAANGAGEIDVLIDDLPGLAGQANRRTWLDGVAYTDAGTQIALNASLDRTTGAITINNPTTTPYQFKAYSLVSTAGGLDATSWTTIAGWTTTATPNTTSQFATDLTQTDAAMTGTTIAANGGSLTFGNVWNPSRFEDVLIRLTRNDNEIAVIVPQYTGPQILAGDFNGNGTINIADFQILLNNLHTTTAQPNQIVASQVGDMNGDLAINFADFSAFRTAYDAQNGAGAFAELAASVPEPSCLAIAAVFFAALCSCGHRRVRSVARLFTTSCIVIGISSSASALEIKVDIDAMRISGTDVTGPIATQSGFTSWDLTNVLAAGGSTFTSNGVTFEIFGLLADNQSRIRLTTGVPNGGGGPENDLLADFVFNEGADGRAIGLRISGLPVGTYAMQSWHNDFGVAAAEATQIEVRNQGEAGDPSQVLLAPRPWSAAPIEYPLQVSTPGQVREVIFREGSGTNRARLNGFTISDLVPPAPIVELTLQVNTTTGAVSIANEQSVPFDMSYYEIRSTTGSLNLAGWTSLDDAEGGDPVGTGWDEAVSSTANVLSEVNLESMRTLSPGNTVSLGSAFTTGSTQNVYFRYAAPNETVLRVGAVEYVTGPSGVNGDYNGNNVVDAADYVVWRDKLGTMTTLPNDTTPGNVTQEDFTVWRANFGRTAGAGAGLTNGAAVPEPATIVSAVLLILAALQSQRRTRGNGYSKMN